MTDAHAEHPPVRYDPEPDVALPSMIPASKPRRGRRSTAVRAKHPRRSRWVATFGFAGLIAVLGIGDAFVMGDWVILVVCLVFAFVTCTTQYLAESDIALAQARAAAEKRAKQAVVRDMRLVSEAYDEAHAIIRANWPGTADDMSARLALDLRRAHLLGHRLDSDAQG